MLAAFEARKNHRAVLNALAQLDRSDIHVAFAGQGPLERAVRAQADRLGVADRVHFLAVVGDVRPLIAASAATLLPSFREGLSRAVLESLAMGVPVVGSRVRGIAELVEPGGGVLVAPGDAGALAVAIEKTADAPAACFDGPAVRARLEPYGIDHLLHAHDVLYNELLAQRRNERNPA
jgi:glycosyltransferase involved in cell wall biosynthesis